MDEKINEEWLDGRMERSWDLHTQHSQLTHIRCQASALPLEKMRTSVVKFFTHHSVSNSFLVFKDLVQGVTVFFYMGLDLIHVGVYWGCGLNWYFEHLLLLSSLWVGLPLVGILLWLLETFGVERGTDWSFVVENQKWSEITWLFIEHSVSCSCLSSSRVLFLAFQMSTRH